MSMSHRALVLLAVLGLTAWPEHAPARYGLTDVQAGFTAHASALKARAEG